MALELADKGYCSTKNMYYHGMKPHALVFRRKGRIPFPEYLTCTPASVNDLEAFKSAFGNNLKDRVDFGDKSYRDKDYFQEKEATNNLTMFTPHKNVKGESDVIRMREQTSNDLFSKTVSTVRQPIESFFNWLNEKIKIQNAQKVRSIKGLLLHSFGRIAAAFIYLIF